MNIFGLHLANKREDIQAHTPPISLFLAYVAMAPMVAGAALAVVADAGMAAEIIRLTAAWAAAILCFLAGVRRGLSFRQPGGPTAAQLAAMLLFFVLGVGSLLIPWPAATLGLLLAGYVSLAIIDPIAARRDEAPLYFARLRPVQMLLPIGSLMTLLAVSWL